jgi:hypothetical protein
VGSEALRGFRALGEVTARRTNALAGAALRSARHHPSASRARGDPLEEERESLTARRAGGWVPARSGAPIV